MSKDKEQAPRKRRRVSATKEKRPEAAVSSGDFVTAAAPEDGGLLDEIWKKQVVALVGLGCGFESAAGYAGVTAGQIRREIGINETFAGEVRRAEERAEVYFLSQIKKAAEKEQYWRAAAWALERRIPNRYAPRGPETMTMDDIREIFRKLAAIILAEVSQSKDRKRVVAQINQVLRDLSAAKRKHCGPKTGRPSPKEDVQAKANDASGAAATEKVMGEAPPPESGLSTEDEAADRDDEFNFEKE